MLNARLAQLPYSTKTMKLGTLRNETRDGALCVVSRNLKIGAIAYDIAPTVQAALDDWDYAAPRLEELYEALNRESALPGAFEIDFSRFQAPLPRAFQWIDSPAYPSHAERTKKSNGIARRIKLAPEPQPCWSGSGGFVGARDPIGVESEEWGIDPAGKIGVITGDVPLGVQYEKAGSYIRLVTLLNDVTLRTLAPTEVDPASGFLQSKALASFAPVAVTEDELGESWDGRKLKLPLVLQINDETLGRPNAGVDMTFNYPRLIAHAARTRPLGAGTIVTAGAVSNRDPSAGFACIAEKRATHDRDQGGTETRFLRFGDRVRLEVFDHHGNSIFGAIDQTVVPQGH